METWQAADRAGSACWGSSAGQLAGSKALCTRAAQRLLRITPAYRLSCSLVPALPPQPTLPSTKHSAPARPGEALGDTGSSAGQGLSLWEAAAPANGVGGSPAATQRSLMLQKMAARAPQASLSKEPCFWIIYTTFRWKYFVFYSVDAVFFIMRPSLKPMCVSYCQANIC